jgi:hypothetical protein
MQADNQPTIFGMLSVKHAQLLLDVCMIGCVVVVSRDWGCTVCVAGGVAGSSSAAGAGICTGLAHTL